MEYWKQSYISGLGEQSVLGLRTLHELSIEEGRRTFRKLEHKTCGRFWMRKTLMIIQTGEPQKHQYSTVISFSTVLLYYLNERRRSKKFCAEECTNQPDRKIELDGGRFRFAGQTGNFCEANELCAEMNGGIAPVYVLAGRRLVDYMSRSGEGHLYWTSINNFLRTSDDSNEWWESGGKHESILPFRLASLPVVGKPSVIYGHAKSRSLHFAQAQMKVKLDVYCERIVNMETSEQNTFQYRAAPGRKESLPSLGESFPCCFQDQNSTTVLHCLFTCTINLRCRGVYYNMKDRSCRLVFYVDALLPQNIPGSDEIQWSRYTIAELSSW
ncbi:hypothetical protein CSKR_107702 [Clonorchis sinensis]|uniref:Uncharacterized protein n=1 Tax=Clonorchis sinensis TaxID=79923 RepID=A0A3R7FS29_CLOSI|nr:hypothetical protein CSKR_107702 [Clonorchis sinensis]